VRDTEASTRVPLRQLRGFTRIHLKPGASQILTFTLTPDDFALVSKAGERVVESGVFEISVGGGQPGTDAPVVMGQTIIR
jgi:beta-glucosidase